MNNRRTVLKAIIGSILGFLGFTQEVKADDLGVNCCTLINGKGKPICFDINCAQVFNQKITIQINKAVQEMFHLEECSITPIHGKINITTNGLKQTIEFKNYYIMYVSEMFVDVVVVDLYPHFKCCTPQLCGTCGVDCAGKNK